MVMGGGSRVEGEEAHCLGIVFGSCYAETVEWRFAADDQWCLESSTADLDMWDVSAKLVVIQCGSSDGNFEWLGSLFATQPKQCNLPYATQ